MMKAKVGDWVRFYNGAGYMAIGVVQYVIPAIPCGTFGETYHTDQGTAFERDVLEVRCGDGPKVEPSGVS